MRGRCFVVSAVLALAACGGEADGPADGPIDAEALSAMILHLPDGPVGARIGDDSHCGGTPGSDGDTGPFLDLVVEASGSVEQCFIQLEGPDATVHSLVVSFPSEELATRAMAPEVFADVVSYSGLECCNADPIGAFTPTAGPGGEALGAASGPDTSAVVGWRTGALVGAVSVVRSDGVTGATAEADRLAAVQHERMLDPVPVADGIDDDRLAGLQSATLTPWWVGETFAPPGFPPLELRRTSSQEGVVEVDYDGLLIQLVDPAAVPAGSETEQMLGFATELFESPCTVTEPIDGPGTAQLFGRFVPDEVLAATPPDDLTSAWEALASGDCPDAAPNVWMATVDVDDIHIRVNPPLCLYCLTPPTSDLPYRTPEGLRAVVAALASFDG